VISYRLGDDTITIHEPPQRNTGIIGGRYLERTRVSKPGRHRGRLVFAENGSSSSGSSLEHPQFYGPSDFYIGATVEVFRQRFVIRSADLFVLKYAEEHPEQFSPSVLDSLRQHLANEPGRPDARLTMNVRVQRRPGDFIRLYAEIRNKLKHMRITERTFKISSDKSIYPWRPT
jgi:EF-hand domain-containing protein 1